VGGSRQGLAFFETLELMPDAEALWHFCAPHRPTILTGLPLGAWAPDQKRRRAARVLGAQVPVITCMSRDKPHWSGPGHVLVDDRASAWEGWERKGARANDGPKASGMRALRLPCGTGPTNR
jgi:hypothetical protein